MTMQKALEILGGDTPLAAERWAERELCGGENDEEPEEDFESDEIAFRAIEMLDALSVADPATKVTVQPYTNLLGHKESLAQVTTAGGRRLWQESSHYRTDVPDGVSREQAKQVWSLLDTCQEKRKPITTNI